MKVFSNISFHLQLLITFPFNMNIDMFALKAIRFIRDRKNNALHELIIFVGSSPSQGDILF
jgi:hypothetical protein